MSNHRKIRLDPEGQTERRRTMMRGGCRALLQNARSGCRSESGGVIRSIGDGVRLALQGDEDGSEQEDTA